MIESGASFVTPTPDPFSLWGLGDEALASLFGVLVGIVLTALTWRYSLLPIVHQMYVSTFLECTRRFSEIATRMPDILRQEDSAKALSSLDAADRAKVLNSLREYFNLCSEEYFLYRRRYIDDNTWRLWQASMAKYCKMQSVQDAWLQLRGEYYDQFRQQVDRLANWQRPG